MSKKQSKEMLIVEIARLKKEIKKKKKYGLVWEDKPEDVVEQCKTELPVLKEIKNKEVATDPSKPVNILIEGDNYHTLSVLNYTHAKKADVIYIDPPYNTGNKDFIYNDQYVDREDGYRHSKWLSFMEKRLKLAKSLLKETGIIFISIDDNEVAQLKMLMDRPEMFGEENFVSCITIESNPRGRDYGGVARLHDYLLVYRKGYKSVISNLNNPDKEFPFKDKIGGFEVRELRNRNIAFNIGNRPNLYYPFYVNPKDKDKNGFFAISLKKRSGWKEVCPKESQGFKTVWRWGKQKSSKFLNTEIVAKLMEDGNYQIVEKYRKTSKMARSIWFDKDVNTEKGTLLVKEILQSKIFTYPKPVEMIKRIIEMGMGDSGCVVDFFAGSGTTGHAVLELNNDDCGNRSFILCTNDEELDGNGNAKKHKICTDVCYPRIRKVIEGYKNTKGEKVEGLGGNLKYFKTSFVSAEPSDKNRKKLTEEAIEMLCVKESAFDVVVNKPTYKIFKNHNHYCGIVLDQGAIGDFKKAIKDIKGKCNAYIFSLTDESFDDVFIGLKNKIKISPIPEAILRVYRRIFK